MCVSVSVSEGKQRPLFALTDVHETSCYIQQLSVQKGDCKLKLLFNVQGGQFRISDTVSCSVTSI